MPPRAKLCGLRRAEDVAAAMALGMEYAGFIFHPTSLRHVTPGEAAGLRAHVPTGRYAVAVTVDAEDDLLERIVREVRPDYLQLHGNESPARAGEIRSHYGIPVIKAIAVRDAQDVASARSYEAAADMLLFDTKAASGASGGTGQSFDWTLLTGFATSLPWFLSGGLGPENIARAVRQTNAALVDASSHLESAPGVKDHEKLAAFAAQLKALP